MKCEKVYLSRIKKVFIISLISCFIFINKGFSQVTIGSATPPQNFSLLEVDASVKNGGLRLPQLTTVQRDALTTSEALTGKPLASGLMIYNTTTNQTEYWDGTKWTASSGGSTFIPVDGLEIPYVGAIGIVDQIRFIYSPSITIDVSSLQSGLSLNIYNEYVKQFSGTGANPLIKNPTTEHATIPVYPANYFDYYITGYDSTVFSGLSISDTGILTYNVIGTASSYSYLNIVMALRKTPR